MLIEKGNEMSIESLMLDTGVNPMITTFEKNCYGMSEADIREQYIESFTAKVTSLEMVVMSILSDVQEDPTLNTWCRKQLNIAKFILSEMMDEKRNSTD